jgi:hypothetical protein
MREAQQLETKYTRILQDREKHPDQSVEEYCRDQGISPWSYYSWKKRLRREPKTASIEKKFLPVHVLPRASLENDEAVIHYEIAFPNGITMRLSGSLRSADHAAIIGAAGAVEP